MITIAYLIEYFTINPHLAYFILFLGSFFETLIGPSFFIYGEVIFLPGAILAGMGVLNIWLVSAMCIIGGLLGDNTSYFIGRKYGIYLVNKVFKKKNKFLTPKMYAKGKNLFNKHGVKSIFFARFLGVFSWITPFVVGTLEVKYSDFLKYNTPSVILGIGQFMIVGYFFGVSYFIFFQQIEKYIIFLALSIVAIILFTLFMKTINKRKKNTLLIKI